MIPVYITQAAAGAAWPGRGRELRIVRWFWGKGDLEEVLWAGASGLRASPSCPGLDPKRALGVRDKMGNSALSG